MTLSCTFLARGGKNYEKSLAMLLSHIDAFDISEADLTVQKDREVIVSQIQEMYPAGGVPAFNKTEIKSAVLNEFLAQRAPFPYKTAIFMSTPTMAFCVTAFSCYRHMPAPFQVAILNYGIASAGALFSIGAAGAMFLGGLFAKYGSQHEATGIRLRHFGAGTIASAAFTLWNASLLHLPMGVAAGVLPQVSAQPWHGPLIGAGVSTITWFTAACIFKPKTTPAKSLAYVALRNDEHP